MSERVVSVRVNLDRQVDDSYDILIGGNIAPAELAAWPDAPLVMDATVHELYPVLAGERDKHLYSPSENDKTPAAAEAMLSYLKDRGSRRDATLFVVGGGITGDVGGFAASMYMRGIDFVQIPTTLLSMVDSSVGGKTGVNFGGAKNNVGAFHQPARVVIDTEFLTTLTDERYLDGVAEIIKYGAMFDIALFNMMIAQKDLILARNPLVMQSVIKRCCEIKADVVRQDEKEGGVRKYLNFGHTVGHAIESDSGYTVSHGFAVAAGMYIETAWAAARGVADGETLARVREILETYGFPLNHEIQDAEVFTRALASDKKAEAGGLTLALTPRIGSATIRKDIAIEDIFEFIGQ